MISENRRRVAKLATDFVGGSETFIFDEVESHQRYEAEVLTLRRQNQHRFNTLVPVHALAPDRGFWGGLESAFCRTTSLSPTFFRLCNERRFDLIHAHFGTAGAYALPYRRPGRPLVVTFHGHEVPLLASRRRFHPNHWGYWLMSKLLLRRADRMLAVSQELAQMLVALGAPPDRVFLYDLGIRIPPVVHSLCRNDRPARVLMIGRLVEKKGFEYGIRAFARATEAIRSATLVIVGDGPLRRRLERVAAECGLGSRVQLRGELPRDKVQDELRRADVLLCPSVIARNGDREGTPTVIKEAGGYGVPTVASYHGGIVREILDGESGFLVPERDVLGLAASLLLLLRKPELAQRMGHAARMLVAERFEIGKQMAVLERHYDEVLARNVLRKAA